MRVVHLIGGSKTAKGAGGQQGWGPLDVVATTNIQIREASGGGDGIGAKSGGKMVV